MFIQTWLGNAPMSCQNQALSCLEMQEYEFNFQFIAKMLVWMCIMV